MRSPRRRSEEKKLEADGSSPRSFSLDSLLRVPLHCPPSFVRASAASGSTPQQHGATVFIHLISSHLICIRRQGRDAPVHERGGPPYFHPSPFFFVPQRFTFIPSSAAIAALVSIAASALLASFA